MKKVFKGNITIENLHIMKDYDFIDGSVYLAGTNITEFKQTAEIGGFLSLEDTNIKEFEQKYKIGGFLDLEDTNITEFKQTNDIGGKIYADKNVKIERINNAILSKNR